MITLNLEQIIELTRGICNRGAPYGKIRGISIDSRKTKEGNLFIALKGGNQDGHTFVEDALKTASAAIVQKPVKVKSRKPVILVNSTLNALQDIAAFWRTKISPKVIAVTGSNGKTTTKDLISHILKKNYRVVVAKRSFNNYIGVPLTIFETNPKTEILVLEMETNEIGGIKRLCRIAQPHIGIITNIGSTHLGFLKSKFNVFREKSEIINGVGFNGTIILNGDSPFAEKIRKLVRGKLLTYSIKRPSDFRAEKISPQLHGASFSVAKRNFKIKLSGEFNVSNALAAIAVARIFDIGWNTIRNRLNTFIPQKGRLNIKKIGKKILIDDSYNANPDSCSALCSIIRKEAGRKILVFGDMLELGEFSKKLHRKTGQEFARAGISKIFYFGEFGLSFIKGAREINKKIEVEFCGQESAAPPHSSAEPAEAYPPPLKLRRITRTLTSPDRSRGHSRRRVKISKSREKIADEILKEKADFIIFKGSRKMKLNEVFDYVVNHISARAG